MYLCSDSLWFISLYVTMNIFLGCFKVNIGSLRSCITTVLWCVFIHFFQAFYNIITIRQINSKLWKRSWFYLNFTSTTGFAKNKNTQNSSLIDTLIILCSCAYWRKNNKNVQVDTSVHTTIIIYWLLEVLFFVCLASLQWKHSI